MLFWVVPMAFDGSEQFPAIVPTAATFSAVRPVSEHPPCGLSVEDFGGAVRFAAVPRLVVTIVALLAQPDLNDAVAAILALTAGTASVLNLEVAVVAFLVRREPAVAADGDPAGELEAAGRIAAVPSLEVAVVTLLPSLEQAVAAAAGLPLTVRIAAIAGLEVAVVALLATFEHSVSAAAGPAPGKPATVGAGPASFRAASTRAAVSVERVSVITSLRGIEYAVPAGARFVSAEWVAAVSGQAIAVLAVFTDVEQTVATEVGGCPSFASPTRIAGLGSAGASRVVQQIAAARTVAPRLLSAIPGEVVIGAPAAAPDKEASDGRSSGEFPNEHDGMDRSSTRCVWPVANGARQGQPPPNAWNECPESRFGFCHQRRGLHWSAGCNLTRGASIRAPSPSGWSHWNCTPVSM